MRLTTPDPAAWWFWLPALNLLLVWVGWPLLHGGQPSSGLAATAMLALGILPMGRMMRHSYPERVGPLLLAGYPVAVGLCALSFPADLLIEAFAPAGLCVAAGSLWAHAAAVSTWLDRPMRTIPHVITPVRRRPWDTPPEPAPQLQVGVMRVGVAAAVGLAVLAPLWDGMAPYREHWDEAATEGALLTAAVAATLGAAVLAVFIGGGVRTRNSTEPQPTPLRVAGLLAAAALGGVVYLVSR